MLVATASARATEIRAQKDFGVCESRAACRNTHAEHGVQRRIREAEEA